MITIQLPLAAAADASVDRVGASSPGPSFLHLTCDFKLEQRCPDSLSLDALDALLREEEFELLVCRG